MKNQTPKLRPKVGFLAVLTCLAVSQPIVQAASLTDGLYGLWPLNEGTGLEVKDVSTNHPAGLLQQNDGAAPVGLGSDGGMWVTDPVRGTVLGFTGNDADGYAFLGPEVIPATDLSDGFTWSFWAKSDQANNNDIILGNRYGIDNAEITPIRQWIKFTGNQFEWRPSDVAANVNYADFGVQTAWMHHLVVRDGNVFRYYRNGVLTLTGTPVTVTLDAPLPLYIGGQGRENWRGYVDEVMLYQRALTAEEVTTVYRITSNGSLNDVLTPGPVKLISVSPADGATGAPFDAAISATILEGTDKVSDASVKFTINGVVVPHTVGNRVQLTPEVSTVTLTANPPTFPNLFLAGSTVSVELDYSDTAGAAKEKNWTFTVQDYITVPPTWAVADVNTAQRGFLVRTHILNNRRHVFGDRGARTPPAENQLAGKVGPNIANPADFTSNGYFVENTFINYNQAAVGRGDAGSSEGMFGATETIVKVENAVPGLEGANVDPAGENNFASPLGSDHAALEILTYLELPAGVVTLGVNSDDGFRLTISPLGAPADKFGRVVAEFDGGRGSSATIGTEGRLVVQEAGIYALRLMWYEGQGGFNGEWYSRKADGTPTLINDPEDPAAIKAYTSRTGAGSAHVSLLTPFPFGSTLDFAYPDDPIFIEITDGATPVDQNSIAVTVNGQLQAPPQLTKTKTGNKTSIEVTPQASVWAPGDLAVKLVYAAGETVTNEWTVPMIPYVTLEDCLRTAVGSGREPGMNWQTHWLRTGTRANNVAAAEDQLLNRPNDADPSGTEDGLFDIANVNFDQVGVVQGMFGDSRNPPRNDAELQVPGMPADAPADPNYIVGVAQTFVEFPTAGMYYMGVNRDDGFRLTVASAEGGRDLVEGPNVQQLGVYNAGGGTDANNVQPNGFMAIYVPQSGVWPLRLLWYEGTGGGNVEWFQTDEQMPIGLVNDNLTTSTLRAFRSRAELPPAITDAICSPLVNPTIAVSLNAQGQVVLTFEGVLQQSDNAGSGFAPVAGATSPFTVTDMSATKRFYRAAQN